MTRFKSTGCHSLAHLEGANLRGATYDEEQLESAKIIEHTKTGP